jgi:hypothetical protein
VGRISSSIGRWLFPPILLDNLQQFLRDRFARYLVKQLMKTTLEPKVKGGLGWLVPWRSNRNRLILSLTHRNKFHSNVTRMVTVL